MKAKIAAFQSEFGVISFLEEWAETSTGYTRVSEYVEVDFPERGKAEITSDKIKQLDKVLAELMTQIESVRAKKSELLALSYAPE